VRNHLIPQRRSLAKTIAAGLLILAQVIAPVAHAETTSYQHDNNGNITQRTTIFGTTTYTYDPLGRLISEAGPAKTQNIAYDANGNRLSDGAGSYTYALTSNRMLIRRGLPVTTDAAGNITADGTGRTFVYNQAGQLAQVKKDGILIATYVYNYRRLRGSKTTTASAPQGAQTVVYHYDLDGKLIAETTETGLPLRAYIWLDDTPLSQIEYVPSRKIYSFNVDHLNTPRSLMDETGKIVWRWDSDAFGSTLPNEDADGDGVKITSNLRFPGQYYDRETGLHYNWHRYYDPTMGQYIQADPIGLEAGENLYIYVLGNPLIYADPSGLDVNICFYSEAAMGFGHVGFGFAGESSTQGFYSGLHPFPFNIYGPGAVKPDKQEEKQCKVIESSPDQDDCMKRCRKQRFITPGAYSLTGRQCTGFVRDCLKQCGLPAGKYKGPQPRTFYNGLGRNK
jgi:RHS repeat-associated protein